MGITDSEDSMIPYGKQEITQEDIDSVVNVLKSDFITQGPAVEGFEQSLQDYCGIEFALAVNSATSALHIACLALGLGEGDWLWTSPNTFVASANCALYCGASIDFVDIDNRSYNMSIECLKEKLIIADREGKLPKIVVPVHFAGQSCDMQEIHSLSVKYGFKVIEDASHAIGGRYMESPVGNCQFSDITVFSFHPVKIITTGEGGIAVTKDKGLYDKMLRLRSHGVTRDCEQMTGDAHGPWYYEQIDLGYNYRMTDIQAALGISQMHRLDSYIKKRHQLKENYVESLESLPLILPYQTPESYSSLHLYPVQIDINEKKMSRRIVFEKMRELGVGVNVHYIPVHIQPYYKQFGFQEKDFPNAYKYYLRTISLPLYSSLKSDEQLTVVKSLEKVLL